MFPHLLHLLPLHQQRNVIFYRPLSLKNKIPLNEISQTTEDVLTTPEINTLIKDDELKGNCLSDLGLTPITNNCLNQQGFNTQFFF